MLIDAFTIPASILDQNIIMKISVFGMGEVARTRDFNIGNILCGLLILSLINIVFPYNLVVCSDKILKLIKILSFLISSHKQ